MFLIYCTLKRIPVEIFNGSTNPFSIFDSVPLSAAAYGKSTLRCSAGCPELWVGTKKKRVSFEKSF
jgi:hypothetical protein